MDPELEIIDWLQCAINWIGLHPYATWGGGSAFLASLWSSVKDGRQGCGVFFTALLSVMLTLSMLAMMHKSGLHEELMPLVGILVGFIGVDRIRTAVLGAWDARKTKLHDDTENIGRK